MKYIVMTFIGYLLVAAAIAGGVVMAFLYKPTADRYVKAQMYQACASANQVEFTDTATNSVIKTPIEDKVRECLTSLEQ